VYSKFPTKVTDKTEINALIGLLCLAGALRSKQILEGLWDTNRDGIEKFRLVKNQRRFKVPMRCILEYGGVVGTVLFWVNNAPGSGNFLPTFRDNLSVPFLKL